MGRELFLKSSDLVVRTQEVLRNAKGWVDSDACISHIGFRTISKDEWFKLRELCSDLGTERVTFKDDGRQVLFVELRNPIVVDEQSLTYLELPEPNDAAQNKPQFIAAFYHPTISKNPQVIGEYVRSGEDLKCVNPIDIRQQQMRAVDYIQRDKDVSSR
ncbi:MAG: VOC family protein [Alphaproteobacteria bacterium]